MIVSEYIAECNATVREKLEELYEKHGRDDSLAYAAYRWGFALVDAQIPETGYIELLGRVIVPFPPSEKERGQPLLCKRPWMNEAPSASNGNHTSIA